jgi:DNA polymerase delta subunit 1
MASLTAPTTTTAPPLEFQVLTYDGRDIERSEFDMAKEETIKTHEYVIDAYGRTADGRSVCVHVSFPPYCFISVEDRDQTKITSLWAALKAALKQELKGNAPTYVTRKRFYGFTDGAQERFMLLCCLSLRALRIAAVIAAKRGFMLFETNVPPPLRLLHMRQLPAVGWVRCNAFKDPKERCTTCDIEVSCSFDAMEPLPERTSNTPLVVASYDIECISESGGFPNALEASCPIIQIATTFWRVTDPEPYKRYLACLGAPLPIEGVDIDACETEQQLLMAWAKVMRQEQVDILIGYNTFGFDNKYVFDRAALKGALGTRAIIAAAAAAAAAAAGGLHQQQQQPPTILNFPYLMAGKRTDHLSEIHVRKLESSAYGQNEFYVHSTPGMLQIDLLAVIKKEYKLTSYKLDAVSAHFLGDNKVDLPIKEMFALYKQGTPEALQKIASYCVKDTELPIRLMRKLSILPNMMEMAKAVHVPIDYLICRGQQIKVFSVILKKARENGFV